MFNFGLKEVRLNITINTDGTVKTDYHFDFDDGVSYGCLFANGQVIIKTVAR